MPRAKGLCQKGAGDHEGNSEDRGTCAESKGAGERWWQWPRPAMQHLDDCGDPVYSNHHSKGAIQGV